MPLRRKRWIYVPGAALTLALALLLVHTSPAKRLAGRALTLWLESRLGGSAQIGRLDYRLWRGELILERLRLAPPPEVYPLALEAKQMTVQWVGLSARVAILEPQVSLSPRPREAAAPEPQRSFAWGALIRTLEVHDGSFRLTDPEGTASVELAPVQAAFERQGDRMVGELLGRGGRWRSLPLRRFSARIGVEEDQIEIHQALVEAADSRIEARGRVVSLSPLTLSGDVDVRIGEQLLTQAGLPREISSAWTGTAKLRSVDGRVGVEGTFDTAGVGSPPSSPLRMDVDAFYQEGAFELRRLQVEAAGGNLEVTGSVSLDARRSSLDVRLSHLDAAELTRMAPGRVLPISSGVDGRLQVELDGWGLAQTELTGQIELHPEPSEKALPLEGSIRLAARSGTLRIETPRLGLPGGELQARGSIAQDGRWTAQYAARVTDLGRLAPWLRGLGLRALPEELSGNLTLQGSAEGVGARPASLAGELSLSSARTLLYGVAFSAEASLAVADRRLQVKALDLSGPGGRVSLNGVLPLGGGAMKLQALLENVEISEWLPKPVPQAVYGNALLSGRIDASGPPLDPNLTASLRLSSREAEPVETESTLALRKLGHRLFLDRLEAQRGGGRASASGRYDLDSRKLELRLSVEELSLRSLLPPSLTSQRLEGVLSRLEAEVDGPLEAPSGTVRMSLRDLVTGPLELPPLTLEATSDGETAKATITLHRDGTSPVHATCRLESSYPCRLTGTLDGLALQGLARLVSPAAPETAQLAASGPFEIALSLLHPAALTYRFEVDQLKGLYEGVAAEAGAPFVIEGDENRLHISGLRLKAPQTAVSMDGWLALSREAESDLSLKSDLQLALLNSWVPNAELEGRAEAELHMEGRFARPFVDGTLRIQGARVPWNGLAVEQLTCLLRADGQTLRLEKLSGTALGGRFSAAGVLPLPGHEVTEPASVEFALEALDLSTWSKWVPETVRRRLHLEPMARLSARGRLQAQTLQLAGVRAAGELSELTLALGDTAIRAERAAGWSFKEGRLLVSSLRLTGGESLLDVGLDAHPQDHRWSLSLRGRLDNTFLTPLLRNAGDVVLTGTTDLHVTATRSPEGPDLRGKGSLNGAQLVIRDPPLVMTRLDGELDFKGRSIVLRGLQADVGGGTVKGSGELELSEAMGLQQMRLQLAIDSVRLNIPEGLRSEVRGALRLDGGPQELVLSGDVRLIRSSYTRRMTLESQLLSSLDRQLPRSSELGSLREKTRLDLRVSTVEALRILNNLAQVEAQANVSVTGTLAAPRLDGLVRSQRGGSFRLGPHTYQIERASILLKGYPAEPPELDVTARTTAGGVEIVLELKGRGQEVSLELRAPDRPELGRGDLASLLVTGRTLENVSEGETASGLESVSGRERRILGEQLAGYLGTTLAGLAQRGLAESFRFDQVALGPSQLGSEVSPELRFTLGKAVTDDLFLTYSIGLANTQRQLWIVDYKLPRQVELRATRQEDNTLTGNVSQKARFDWPGRRRPSPPVAKPRRVSSVRLEGAPPGWEERLSKRLRSHRGKTTSYWKAQEDARRLERMLRHEGYLGATVELLTKAADSGTTDLTYRIHPGRPIRIQWEGDAPEKAVRDLVEAAWEPRLPESFLLSDLARLVQSELQRRGFYAARVEAARVEAARSDAPEGARQVVFRVQKGPRGSKVLLDFEGNRALTDRELREVLPKTSSAQFFQLLSSGASEIEERLRAVYLAIGVLDARVLGLRTDYDEGEAAYRVVVTIEEQPQARVTDVGLEGVSSLDKADLVPQLGMIVGMPFRLSDYERDLSTLVSIYRKEGYPEARVQGRLERRGGAVKVIYHVEEGPRARIRSVRVVGNQRTKTSLILERAALEAGRPLRLAELAEAERRVYELGVFRSVDARVAPAEKGSTERDVVIRVEEASDVELHYGLRFSSQREVDLLTELRVPNVLGRAYRAFLTMRASNDESLLRGTWHMPRWWKLPLSTDVIASRETEDDVAFRQTRWKLAFQQSRNIRQDLACQWTYTYKWAHTVGKVTDDSPFPFDFVTRQSVLSSSLVEDRRDSVLHPTRGRFWNITFQFAPEALGSDVRFVKLFGQLFTFHPLGSGLVWASSYRAGLARGFGQRLLPEDRFRAGGANTVRGFERDALGPVDPITSTRIGGDAVVIYNQELRFPLYRWLRGVVFYDGGNVFLRAKDFRPFDLRHSGGAGLRLVLPFGLLRWDVAWVLAPREGEPRRRFWFSLNHAF